VAAPFNTGDSTCGSGGSACDDCTARGSACNATTFTCATDGGSVDGGGCASGCSLPNAVCAPGTTTNNCGINGASCAACMQGETCVAIPGGGHCVSTRIVKHVGDPCASAAECKVGLGPDALCKTSTSSGNGTYLGGYCTLPCQTTCPSGSSCVLLAARFGEADQICWDDCGSGDSCRSPGYACYKVNGSGECWINPLPVQDAGPPADKVGLPCATDAACQNPPDQGGVCLSRSLGLTWPDGYCSKSSCATDDECSPDGGALCISFGSATRCISRCGVTTHLDGGQADCRLGYLCEGYTSNLPDGGQVPSNDGICLPPPPPPPANTGAACTSTADCLVPATTVADCLPELIGGDGGYPSGFPGGYCSKLGCRRDSDCAPGDAGVCLDIGLIQTACFARCPQGGGGRTTCRADYVCTSYLLPLADGGSEASVDGYCAASCTMPGAGCLAGTCNASTGYCE
jgi:hypothetical protein